VLKQEKYVRTNSTEKMYEKMGETNGRQIWAKNMDEKDVRKKGVFPYEIYVSEM